MPLRLLQAASTFFLVLLLDLHTAPLFLSFVFSSYLSLRHDPLYPVTKQGGKGETDVSFFHDTKNEFDRCTIEKKTIVSFFLSFFLHRFSITSSFSFQTKKTQTRLAKYYVPLDDASKRTLEYDVHRLTAGRDSKLSNVVEVRAGRQTEKREEEERKRKKISPFCLSLCFA